MKGPSIWPKAEMARRTLPSILAGEIVLVGSARWLLEKLSLYAWHESCSQAGDRCLLSNPDIGHPADPEHHRILDQSGYQIRWWRPSPRTSRISNQGSKKDEYTWSKERRQIYTWNLTLYYKLQIMVSHDSLCCRVPSFNTVPTIFRAMFRV